MTLANNIKHLILKDIRLEWRQRYAINGILLYILMVVFVIFLSFQAVETRIWNTLFWIVLLFASVNAIAKSFVQESRARDIYYYTLTNPLAVIIAKMIYNIFMMLLLAITGLLFYSMILGYPVVNTGAFILSVVMGAIGFSLTFTMVAGIASKANNSTALMAILSFPVFIPMLMVLLNISINAVEGAETEQITRNFIVLLAIDIVVITLSLILFPYIWRD